MEVGDKKRNSDIYIFCHVNHKIHETFNPLDLTKWDFYILPTKILDEKLPKSTSISLKKLKSFNPKHAKYNNLKESFHILLNQGE